jgi:hypothetical protein
MFFSFLQIHLEPEEFIVKLSGTFHPCRWDRSIPSVVSSLHLSLAQVNHMDLLEQSLVQSNSRIVGFFAHGENYIEAIGAYIRTLEPKPCTSE